MCEIQFGKQLAAQQIPAWSVYYVDYKGLKKVRFLLHRALYGVLLMAGGSP